MSEITHTIMGYGYLAVAQNNGIVVEFDAAGNETVEYEGVMI